KTTAWVSMHEKDQEGNWRVVMTTPGFIGKEGLGKTQEGDGRTPVGTFRFNAAFGIAEDPGCAIPYTRVDKRALRLSFFAGISAWKRWYTSRASMFSLPCVFAERGV
ncbi:MAG: hypothetical protein J5963_01835, partial [Schwartzia sp.]|nr:hypothetical protein [Schwartzia sp. (in: firmicutes)]